MELEELKKTISRLIIDSKEICFLFLDKVNENKEGYEPKSKFSTSQLGIVYQSWYSKALKIIKVVLPERVDEFIGLYLPNDKRKTLDPLNYTISDFFKGLENGLVRHSFGQRLLFNQVDILSSCIPVLDSKLNDLISNFKYTINEKELDSAKKLFRNGYYRSSGAICGVLLEDFLQTKIAENGNKSNKKNPTLGDLIQFAYEENVIDSTIYKKLLFLSDIRNKCDHKKTVDPTKEEVESLIFETEMIISCF